MKKNDNAPIKWIWWGIIGLGLLTSCLTSTPKGGNKSISGKILDESGDAQKGVIVRLLEVPIDSLTSTSWLDVDHLSLDTMIDTTDENGNYSFGDVEPGYYAVVATYINGSDTSHYFIPNEAITTKNVNQGSGTLSGSGGADIEIVKSGRPLSNILCVLPELHISAISDNFGVCKFKDLPPGDYQVIYVSDIYDVNAGKITVIADRTIQERNFSADYKVEFLSLVLQSSDGGSSIIPTNAVSVSAEKKVGIEAIPGANVTFVRWEVKEGDVVFDNILDEKTNVVILENAKIEAIFRTNVVLRVNAGEGGTVTTGYFSLALGAPANIEATANSGWQFDRWTVESGIANFGVPGNPQTDVTIFENTTIVANFRPPSLEVTLQADTGGIIVPEVLQVEEGKSGTIQAVPDAGYVFTGWEVVSGSITIQDLSSPNTLATVNGPGIIRAKFAQASGKLSLSVEGNGSTDPNDSAAIKYGTALSVSATPDSGWGFNNWEVVSGTATFTDANEATTTLTAQTDASIKAVFSRGNVNLVISHSGNGSASPAGTTSVAPDSAISLTATPSANWRFNRWVISQGAATLTNRNSAQTTVSLQSSASIHAQFLPELVLLSFEQVGEGILTPGNDTQVVKNQAVSISAVAAENWVFDRWQIAAGSAVFGSTSESSTTVTLSTNAAIRAVFRVPNFELRASTEGEGTVSLDTLQTVQGATPLAVQAAAAVGWSFSKWEVISGTASFADASSSATTLQITTDASVKAVFLPSKHLLTVTTNGTGTTSPSDTITTTTGSPTAITATAGDSWKFVNWTVVSGSVNFDDAFKYSTNVYASSDATIQANFSNNTAVLRVTVYGEGTTSPSGEAALEIGKATQIVATPAEGWKFDHWGTLDGNAVIADVNDTSTTVTITGEANIKAVFVDNRATLYVSTEGTGTTVPASVDTVEKGVPFPISATPGSGYSFVRWEVIEGEASISSAGGVNGGNTVTVTSSSASIKAVFSQDNVTLSIMAAPGGTVNPSEAQSVAPGTNVDVTGTPDSGAVFSEWKRVTGAVAIESKYSATTNITVNGTGTVKGYFKYPMVIVVVGEGSTTPSGATNVYPGSSTEISATPAEGWSFDHWKVGAGNAVIEDSTMYNTSITMNSPATIGVVFKQDPITLTVQKLGQGAVSPTPDTTVDVGNVFSIHAAPATSWGFSHWEKVSGNVVIEDTTDPNTAVQLYSNATVKAHFIDEDTIFVGKVGEGYVSPAGYQFPIISGSNLQVNASPGFGWRFDRWVSLYKNVVFQDSTSPATTITVNGNDTIAAYFIEQVTLDLTKEGNGSVTPKQTVTLDAGGSTLISATPLRYNKFKEWKLLEGNAQIVDKNNPSTYVVVNDSSTIEARFEKFNLVTTSHTGLGETSPYLDTVTPGEIISLGAVPNTNQGWVFWEWKVNFGQGQITDPKAAQTTGQVFSDSVDFKATFVKQADILTLGVTSNDGGTTIPSGLVQLLKSVPFQVNAIPNHGNCFDKWIKVSGELTISNPRSLTTNVTATTNGSVQASFKSNGSQDPPPGGICEVIIGEGNP